MRIWKQTADLQQIKRWCSNTLSEHLAIEVTEIGEDYLRGTMPVDARTHQPMGILHGGASVALAESLGSIAAHLAAEPGVRCVGLDINANHVRSVSEGLVTGTARPLHIGSSTQVWEILLHDDAENLVCVSRLTMAVLGKRTQ